MKLVDAIEVLRLGDQQQLRVPAGAHEREGLQQVPVGEVLARGQELALVLRALLGVQAPPRGVELQEGVLDEVALGHLTHRLQAHPTGARRRRLRWPPQTLLTGGQAPEAPVAHQHSRRAASAKAAGTSQGKYGTGGVRVQAVRIALVSPYSWTYPGGVTRHIEALADELQAAGHEARILAPFDPDDALSRVLHRGARPQCLPRPERFVPLGRTMGFPANGAISNLAATPDAVLALWRELRAGGYDLVHVHEPVVPLVGWYAPSCAAGIPLVGTFHTFSENALTNGIGVALGARRHMNRLHARIAVSEAAAWTAQRFFGGRYRIVPNGVHLHEVGVRAPARSGEEGVETPARRGPEGSRSCGEEGRGALAGAGEHAGELRVLFIGQAVERKGLPVLLRAFEALREHVPATLTLVGAGPEEVAPLLLDDRGVHALGKVSEEEKAAQLRRADVLCAPSLGGESFGMVLTEAFAAGTPVVASDIAGYRDVVRDGCDGLLTPRGDARALAEALRVLALDPARRARMAAAARERAERFAWPHVAAEVLEVYEQALAHRARGRARSKSIWAPRGAPWPRARRSAAARARPAAAQPRAGSSRYATPRRALRTMRRAALARGLARRPRARADRACADRRRPCAREPRRFQPRAGRGGPRADVRLDGRPRSRLARDPQRRSHLAAARDGETRCRGRSSAC